MNGNKQIINLVMGDTSRDGHEKTESVFILTAASVQEIRDAYEVGVCICGVDVVNKVAEAYEDSTMSEEDIQSLEAHGFKRDRLFGYKDLLYQSGGKNFISGTDAYACIFLFLVNLGDPNIEFLIVDIPEIDIGGYGMFV